MSSGSRTRFVRSLLTSLAIVISLRRLDHRVFVGIFLIDLLIEIVDQREDTVIRCFGCSVDLSLVAVADILLRHIAAAYLHDTRLYHVLDILDADCVRQL